MRNERSALAAVVRLEGESGWRSSDLGRTDFAISRSEWFRTAIELPPDVKAEQIAEWGFRCLAPDEKQTSNGICHLEGVSKAFLLDADYRPGPNLWRHPVAEDIRLGETRVHPSQ